MSAKLLQVNFSFDIPGDQLVQAVAPAAESYAAVPGLIWKLARKIGQFICAS